MIARGSVRLAWAGLLLAGALALLADGVTTYAALTSPTRRYLEASPAAAAMFGTLGLGGGIAATIAARLAAFALAAIAARRYRRLGVPLYLIVLLGVAYTGAIAVSNLEELAR